MPWNLALCVLVLTGGCLFSADYGNGQYRCSDGKCPSGLLCTADERCIRPSAIDAPLGDVVGDVPIDMMIDGRVPAFTCADPGVVLPAGGTEMGTTVGRSSTISAMCGGFVMNGADAVYRVTAAAGDMYLIDITGVRAYVIAPCSASPATPSCIGNMFASAGNPIAVTTTFAGQHFIVVDHETPATTGAYTLTVTKQ
jgi:hypothetical protein